VSYQKVHKDNNKSVWLLRLMSSLYSMKSWNKKSIKRERVIFLTMIINTFYFIWYLLYFIIIYNSISINFPPITLSAFVILNVSTFYIIILSTFSTIETFKPIYKREKYNLIILRIQTGGYFLVWWQMNKLLR
jgi:hypothetical protein